MIDLRPDDVLARAQEVAPPAVRMQAEYVVGQHALMDRNAQPRRQHVPVVGLRPWDVDEVCEQRVRTPFAHELRREVKVVVVQEDSRVRPEIELGDDRVRKALVHRCVAVEPRVAQSNVDVRRGGKAPHVVL